MKKLINTSIAAFLAAIVVSCNTLSPEQVKVREGILEGTIEDGLRVFMCVPFAAPPVG